MLPERLLRFDVHDGCLLPRYVDDEPWLTELLDTFRNCRGQTRGALQERLRDVRGPRELIPLATHLLQRWLVSVGEPALPPRTVRAAVFAQAAGGSQPRDRALAAAAQELDTQPDVLEACLFADLPHEHRVKEPPEDLTPTELARRINMAQVQAILFRAAEVRVHLVGDVRGVIRHTKQRGLITTVLPTADPDQVDLAISGPIALFRRTRIYGRALSSLIPLLTSCRFFNLIAECHLRDRGDLVFNLSTGAPIFSRNEARRPAVSPLERRFMREFAKATSAWQLTHQPEPIRGASDLLVFPDFAIHPVGEDREPFHLEILGFWTPDYLTQKLTHLRASGLPRLILCIDAERNCGEGDLPPHARVIRYRKRIDPTSVLGMIERDPIE